MFHLGCWFPCLSLKVLLKRGKKILPLQQQCQPVSFILVKGQRYSPGEIFLLAAQEERAEHMSELSLPLALTPATPNPTQPIQVNLEYLETSALRGPADFSSGPFLSLLPHWLCQSRNCGIFRCLQDLPRQESTWVHQSSGL